MAIFMSPGVYVREKDLTGGFPAVATASAALVGYSAKGSVDGVMLMTNPRQFLEQYGEPDPASGHYFHYAALAYLARGNTLYCLRVANNALYGGVDIMKGGGSSNNIAILTGKSSTDFDPGTSTYGEDKLFQILGANPGIWNNNISVTIENIKTIGDPVISDRYTFEIVVYYENEDGVSEEVERWKVSRQSKKDGFGKDLYLESKINGVSNYIVVADSDHDDLADTILPKAQMAELVFAQGSDGNDIVDADLTEGWDLFANPSDVDVRILINGGETSVAVQQKMQTVAEARVDCIAVLDMPWSAVQTLGGMTTFRTNMNINSSYCAVYTPWLQIYDNYNDKVIYVPPSGYVAAQYAYNDYVDEPWFAPAGFKRGILNVLSTSYIFTEGERDTLYSAQINMIQLFRNEGIVIWGQKTLQTKTSALSSINVRRLFIIIEKTVAAYLRQFVQEPNDEITRFRVKARIDEYLDGLAAKRAFQQEANDKGFYVLCDENNNTPLTIDQLQMNVDLFVKPIRAAEFIQLQVISTPTGAKIEEMISKGAIY